MSRRTLQKQYETELSTSCASPIAATRFVSGVNFLLAMSFRSVLKLSVKVGHTSPPLNYNAIWKLCRSNFILQTFSKELNCFRNGQHHEWFDSETLQPNRTLLSNSSGNYFSLQTIKYFEFIAIVFILFFLHLNQYSQKANIRKQLMFSFVQHKNCSFMQSKETIESNHLGERIHVKSISVRAAYRM